MADDYKTWKAKAVKQLDDKRAENTPHKVWRNLYIQNKSPVEAAVEVDRIYYNSTRSADQRKRDERQRKLRLTPSKSEFPE